MPELSKSPDSGTGATGPGPTSPDLGDLIAELEGEVSEGEVENADGGSEEEPEEESVSSAEDELDLSPDEAFLQEYAGEDEWGGEAETIVGPRQFPPPLTTTPDLSETESVGGPVAAIIQSQDGPESGFLQQLSAEENEGSAFDVSEEEEHEHTGDEWFGGVRSLIARAAVKREVIHERELERLQERERLLQERREERLRQQEKLRQQQELRKQRELSVRESIMSFENEFEGEEHLGEYSGRKLPPARVSEYKGEGGELELYETVHGSEESLELHASEEELLESPPEEEEEHAHEELPSKGEEVQPKEEEQEQMPAAEESKPYVESEISLSLAGSKQETLLKQLKTLKARLRLLKHRNSELPSSVRFTKEDFVVDERPGATTKTANEEQLVEYYRAQEFAAAKQFVRMRKIQDFFLNIEAHHVVLKDLEHQNQVSTFRIRTPSEEFWKIIERNQKLLEEEESPKTELSVERVPEAVAPVKRFYAQDMIGDFKGKKYDVGTMHAIQHLEKRLEKRYERECEWARLDAQRIRDDWVDEGDVAALRRAEETLGDYKLKLDNNFIGDGETTAHRRQRILDLKLEMYEKMHQFNKLVYLLKDEKPRLMQECRRLIQELVRLQGYLPASLRKPIPVLHDLEPSEQPEKLFEISAEDVQKKIEEKVAELGFQQQKEAMERKLFGAGVHSFEAPVLKQIPDVYKHKAHNLETDAILSEPPRPTQEAMKSLTCKAFTPKIQPLPQKPSGTDSESLFDGLHASVYRHRQLFYEAKNDSESDTTKLDNALLHRKFQQQTLYDKLYQKINYYKKRVLALVGEKVHLQANLKMMHITLTNFLEELDISKHFDYEEHTIEERLERGHEELAAMKEKAFKLQRKAERAHDRMEKMLKDMEDNRNEAAKVIGENHRFVEYLWKLFKTSMDPTLLLDRSKSSTEGHGHSRSHVEESQERQPLVSEQVPTSNSLILSKSSSGNGNGDAGGVESPSQSREAKEHASVVTKVSRVTKAFGIKYDFVHCPEGLDKSKFDRVRELRGKQIRKRVELESRRRALHHSIKHFEQIEGAAAEKAAQLAELVEDIHTIQKRKQERINNVDKVVLARSHQIQCSDDEKLEDKDGDLEHKILDAFLNPNEILAISSGVTGLLDVRTEELKVETKMEQDKLRRAMQLLRRVKEELLKKEKSIIDLERSCNEDMVKKFGRPVDLDQLSAAVINLGLLDATAKLERRRNQQFVEDNWVKKEIQQAKNKLMGTTRINSELNALIAILEERQRDIEYYMHLQGKDVEQIETEIKDQPLYEVSESSELRAMNEGITDEIDRLDGIIWGQEMRIGMLRSIIGVCKTKEGVPPLIPLRSISKDRDVGRMFATYQELQQYRESRDKNVITLYAREHMMDKLEASNSQAPFAQHHQKEQPPTTDGREEYAGEADEDAQPEPDLRSRKSVTEMEDSLDEAEAEMEQFDLQGQEFITENEEETYESIVPEQDEIQGGVGV